MRVDPPTDTYSLLTDVFIRNPWHVLLVVTNTHIHTHIYVMGSEPMSLPSSRPRCPRCHSTAIMILPFIEKHHIPRWGLICKQTALICWGELLPPVLEAGRTWAKNRAAVYQMSSKMTLRTIHSNANRQTRTLFCSLYAVDDVRIIMLCSIERPPTRYMWVSRPTR